MMKFKRFTALFVVLVLLCVFMVVPASAAEPSVFTASYNEDNQLIIDSFPQPGEYSFSFSFVDTVGYLPVYSDSVLLSYLQDAESGTNYLFGSFPYVFPSGTYDISLIIVEDYNVVGIMATDAKGNEYMLSEDCKDFTLTSIATSLPDAEQTQSNFLGDIGIFFTSCMKMLSDVLGIVLNTPVLLVSVLAIPAIFFVISIASRLKT